MPKKTNRYPEINLRSKNDLAKRISSKALPYHQALNLINLVIKNFDKYWHDVKASSKPKEGKFVRSCKDTPLDKLLRLINTRILSPYDNLLPEFIFGGVSGKSHVGAVIHLLGNQRKRSKLSLDIKCFFEKNKRDRIFNFFRKSKCSIKVSNMLVDLCSVPIGRKGAVDNKVLARGFSTSSRLAVWCNLDLFLKVYWKTNILLKNHDPKLAIFVDDIGITASRVQKQDLELLYDEIALILSNHDSNQSLLIHPKNSKKTDFKCHTDSGIEHLGLAIGKNRISAGKKSRYKLKQIKMELSQDGLTRERKRNLLMRKKSSINYKKYIRTENFKNTQTKKIQNSQQAT